MRNRIRYSLLLGWILLFTACDDYLLNNMVDDKVYLLKAGFHRAEISEVESFYELYVIKSGAGQQAVTLKLEIDESVLTAYNEEEGTAYRLLPSDSYTLLSNTIGFDEEGYREAFRFDFNMPRMRSLLEEEGEIFALPCRVTIPGHEIEASRPDEMYSIIALALKNDYIEFSEWGVMAGVRLYPDATDKDSTSYLIRTNYRNEQDITFTLEVKEELLDEYNQANGTSYLLLPEAAYGFNEAEWNVPANARERRFFVNLFRSGLLKDGRFLFGEYMLPVQITTVSKYGINPEQSVMYIPVSFIPYEFDRSSWQIIDYSDQDVDNPASAILDGNQDTFWHSYWGDQNAPLPHYVIIDMLEEKEVSQIELCRRLWSTDTRTVEIEFSMDGTVFTNVGKVEYGYAEWWESSLRVLNITPTKARYVKVIATESNNPPHTSIAEVYIRGTR
ncbi:MAG: DUF1735 domain-containing protein [Tannerellaceae bacterium]|nr:DUF1735 domain-containing protein [Tannerellaceae bacterium]